MTFHNGKENSRAIIKYIVVDIKRQINVDRQRFSPTSFRSPWVHPALCDFHDHDSLVFFLEYFLYLICVNHKHLLSSLKLIVVNIS